MLGKLTYMVYNHIMNIENKESTKYKSTATIVYACRYHVIWTTKYRRKVLSEDIQTRLKELILSKQQEYDFEVLQMETMQDHIHILIDANPHLGIDALIGKLKGYSSHELRDEFPVLRSRLPCLWTRSKFIATVGSVSLEVVKKYIEEQKNV